MLSKGGVFQQKNAAPLVSLCAECSSSLSRSVLPRCTWVNGLFRGELPQVFKDLTWVEEMMCSIYRINAVVTRLFYNANDKDPNVLHGNTCAHAMNVLSTASVLPRTLSDMNNMLTVVFIGPVLKLDKLKTQFLVRKTKVWDYLNWLRANNDLYKDIILDKTTMDLYPEDDLLPGIDDRVLFSKNDDPQDLFQDETAALSEHPAKLTNNTDNIDDGGSKTVFVDRFGVCDPTSSSIPLDLSEPTPSRISRKNSMYKMCQISSLVKVVHLFPNTRILVCCQVCFRRCIHLG
jgi:hypothetical protein